MNFPLNYLLFKKLANKRFTEAVMLKNKKYYSGAYYLGGYVIEFALNKFIKEGNKK